MSTDMFPDAAIEHIVSVESLRRRLAVAYTTAIAAQRRGGRVSIHVSGDVWEAFRRFVRENVAGGDWRPIETFWGFPLVEEGTWESDRIVVRSDEEIW